MNEIRATVIVRGNAHKQELIEELRTRLDEKRGGHSFADWYMRVLAGKFEYRKFIRNRKRDIGVDDS